MDDQNNILVEEKDKCVFCGKETNYLFSTPISQRVCYIEGAGQLCQKCYYGLFIKKDIQ